MGGSVVNPTCGVRPQHERTRIFGGTNGAFAHRLSQLPGTVVPNCHASAQIGPVSRDTRWLAWWGVSASRQASWEFDFR